jgi:hypothetical protein
VEEFVDISKKINIFVEHIVTFIASGEPEEGFLIKDNHFCGGYRCVCCMAKR